MRQFNTLTGFLLSKSDSPTINDTVEFQGYDEVGDGGGATWKHNGLTGQAPSQSPAQLGNALLNDGNGNQWALVDKNPLSVFSCGASASSVDNTLEIQAAINGSDFISSNLSTELISGTLTVSSNKVIENFKLKTKNSTNAELISTERNAESVIYNNIEIDGNSANNTGACHGIRFNGSTDCKVKNSKISNTSGNGISAFIGDTSNNNLRIEGNKISSSEQDGIEIRGSKGLFITNNNISSWGAGFNGVEFQEAHEDVVICSNIFTDTRGDLFAIESAGTPANVSNFVVCNNTFNGSYMGVSGRFNKGTISENTFDGGIGTWRSGIEMAGSDLVISANRITNGAIVAASDNNTGLAKNIIIDGNFITCLGVDVKGVYIGAPSSAPSTPTISNIKISNNTIDMSGATGSGVRGINIGQYGSFSIINETSVKSNFVIGDGVTASTNGVMIQAEPASGKVSVDGNKIKGFANNVRLTNNNLTRFIASNNDVEDFISNAILDLSTTTTVTLVNNIV